MTVENGMTRIRLSFVRRLYAAIQSGLIQKAKRELDVPADASVDRADMLCLFCFQIPPGARSGKHASALSGRPYGSWPQRCGLG
ncbi:hypothetical protein SBA4_1630024 [Candidatus Sulfopaludibacter sp. SbA4]|nr:hypothetical protein SBA4_1630024 [Candidatus Sulfopaludibacter sp. SbA4]